MLVAWVAYDNLKCRGEATKGDVSQTPGTHGRGLEVRLGHWFEASFCKKGFLYVGLQGTLRAFGVWSCIVYLGRICNAGYSMEPCLASWQVQTLLALLATCPYHLVSSLSGALMVPLECRFFSQVP